MTLGTSLFLIAIGAILRFAVSWHVAGIDLHVAGVILMVVGGVGALIGLWLLIRTPPPTYPPTTPPTVP
jgi:uncharacterized membrane protein YfcA